MTEHTGRSLTIDLFRLHTIQADVVYEKFLCDNPDVDTFETKIYDTPGCASVDDLIKALSETTTSPVIQAYKAVDKLDLALFVTPDCVFHLRATHNHSFPRILFIAACHPGQETFKRIEATLLEQGYTVDKEIIQDDLVPISFAMPSAHGVNEIEREFSRLPLDSIAQNYSSELIPQVRRVLTIMEEVRNGILILHGPPGTGKSYLIRAILSELKGIRYPVVCTPPDHFLTNMTNLTEAATLGTDRYYPEFEGDDDRPSKERSTVVVLEDIGELLAMDNVSTRVNETSNLLNFTDGMMAMLANAIFLVSFNHDIGKISPALTRPGRCIGQLMVGNLSFEQARGLVDDVHALPKRPYTLAEVYHINQTGEIPEPTDRPSVLRVGGTR